MPSLFIVVDEFSEMLSAKPEFIDLFVAIGRLGRSLGLHLLLASQRLEEGRLRGLESHLSYRIGLRTFSAQESRAVLGVPDAYELPAVPGLGYLKPDPTSMTRFKAAYVSGPPSGRVRVRRDEGGHLQGILPFTISEVQALTAPDLGPEPDPEPEPAESQETLLDIAVERMVGEGPAAHQVWLPPLDVPDTLDQLMGDLTEDPSLGLVSAGLAVPGRPRGPARHRRPAARAAPRHPHRQPQRGRRPRGGRRRAAQRQEHDAAHHRHEHVADDHPAGVAVLRARLRRRHVRAARRPPARRRRRHPLRAGGGPPDPGRGGRDRRPPRGLLPQQRHRLDRDLPQPSGAGPRRRRVRRRLPGHRRLEHAPLGLRRPRDGGPAARHPRPHVRPAHRHRRGPLGRLPGLDARPVRHPAGAAARRPDGLRDRPQGRGAGALRTPGPRSGAGQAALPRRAAADRRRARRRHPRRRRRGPDQAGLVGLDRTGRAEAAAAARPDRPRPDPRDGRGLRRRRAGRDRGPAAAARHQREGARPGRASTPTPSRTC